MGSMIRNRAAIINKFSILSNNFAIVFDSVFDNSIEVGCLKAYNNQFEKGNIL
jgi:hypothetical protein